MKKTLFFAACAMLVAGMTASCGNKNAEETTDSVIDSTPAPVETVDTTAAQPEAAATTIAADDPAMLAAAKKAGQDKCNCYKKDAASVESCIKAILSASYATYKDNDAFKAAMDKEYKSCIKSKATAAAKDAGNKAVKAGAEALSKKLNKTN